MVTSPAGGGGSPTRSPFSAPPSPTRASTSKAGPAGHPPPSGGGSRSDGVLCPSPTAKYSPQRRLRPRPGDGKNDVAASSAREDQPCNDGRARSPNSPASSALPAPNACQSNATTSVATPRGGAHLSPPPETPTCDQGEGVTQRRASGADDERGPGVGTRYANEGDRLLDPKPLEGALEKATLMLNNTKESLAKKGRGATNAAEKETISLVIAWSLEFLKVIHPIIEHGYCTRDGKFLLRPMEDPLSSETGQYDLDIRGYFKTGCNNSEWKELFGRVWEQLKKEYPGVKRHEEKERIVKARSCVYFTLQESLEIVGACKDLVEIVEAIRRVSPALQCHPDHREAVFGETVNYLMELTMAAMFRGTPGYVMEKALNLGTEEIRSMLALPCLEDNAAAVGVLRGVDSKRPFFTWPPLKSCVYQYIDKNSESMDDATMAAIRVMLRSSPKNEFVQNDLTLRNFACGGASESDAAENGTLEPFVNAVPSCAAFDASERVCRDIDAVLEALNIGDEKAKRTIRDAIASIDNSTNNADYYMAPAENVYQKDAVTDAVGP